MEPHTYVVHLTSKERQELRRLKRQAKTKVRLADRARILLWAHRGVTIDATATHLECGRDSDLLATSFSARVGRPTPRA